MRDRSPIWIAMADLLLCVLAIVIAAVNPKSEAKGIDNKADYLITAEYRPLTFGRAERFGRDSPLC